MKATERDMTAEEARFLRQVIEAHPSRSRKYTMTFVNWALTFGFTMLIFVAGWLLAAWVLRAALDMDVGWGNRAVAPWVLLAGGVACAIYSAVSAARWARGWIDTLKPMRTDLVNQRVDDEEYEFLEAMRMQEPEHLGLIYFLRQADGSAFVYFDQDSLDTALRSDAPSPQEFVPRRRLRIARAPESSVILSREFYGDALPAGDPIVLSVSPKRWPEDEEVCSVPWDRLVETYAK